MRLFTIGRTFVKYSLDRFLPNMWQRRILHLGFFWQSRAKTNSRAHGLRLFLEELGPVYIKFGQLMSVRRDLLPDDIADELAKLQDAVPAMPWQQVESLIADEIKEQFAHIEPEAIAAASVAQVHRGVKLDGSRRVLKVLREDLKQTIDKDIRMAKGVAKFVESVFSDFKRLRLVELIVDYDKVIHDELDLTKEAANISQVRRNFADSDMLYVPEIDWELSNDTVLTLEEVTGIPVGDVDRLKDLNVNMKVLGERGVEIFFTQVFRDNFFHADMHPGNIFVDIDDPENPKYVAVDFGIMGALPKDDQYFLAETLLAFFNNNYANLAQNYIRSGWVPSGTNVIELEAEFRAILEPYMGMPISKISFGNVLMKLFKVSGRFGMTVQPQMVLLDKTLLYIEGLGRQLYPELDLWSTAKPYVEKWLKDRIGLIGFVNKSKDNLAEFISNIPEAPMYFHQVLDKAIQGNLEIKYTNDEVNNSLANIQKNQKQLKHAFVAGSLLVVAALLLDQDKLLLAILAALLATVLYFKK